MASVFYVIGAVVMASGAGWAWLVFSQPVDGLSPGAITAGRLIAVMPSLGVVFAGLLIAAVGGILARLDRIEQNTRRG